MSVDPSDTANASDPSSWNRYAYVQGDPVNFVDPSGEIAVAVEGGGGILGGIFAFFTFGIFGGGTPSNYFAILADREIWRKTPEKPVHEWDLRIAAAVADAARQRDDDGNPFKYPSYLKVIGDCYTFYVGSVKRIRTYEVDDQTGKKFDGSVLVRETNHVAYGELDPKASNRSWNTVVFEDYLARGYGEDILQYQQFTVMYSMPNGVFNTIPIPVLDRDGQMYGTQGIKMMQDKVLINRDNGTASRCN